MAQPAPGGPERAGDRPRPPSHSAPEAGGEPDSSGTFQPPDPQRLRCSEFIFLSKESTAVSSPQASHRGGIKITPQSTSSSSKGKALLRGSTQTHTHTGGATFPLPGTALKTCHRPLAEHWPAGVPAPCPVCHVSQRSQNSLQQALPTPTCKGGQRRVREAEGRVQDARPVVRDV